MLWLIQNLEAYGIETTRTSIIAIIIVKNFKIEKIESEYFIISSVKY